MDTIEAFAELQTTNLSGGGGANILFPSGELLVRFPSRTKRIFLLAIGQLLNGTGATGTRRTAIRRAQVGGATTTVGELVDGALLAAAGQTEGFMYAATEDFGESGRLIFQGNTASLSATGADSLSQNCLLVISLG